jgi:hypothetical protein
MERCAAHWHWQCHLGGVRNLGCVVSVTKRSGSVIKGVLCRRVYLVCNNRPISV